MRMKVLLFALLTLMFAQTIALSESYDYSNDQHAYARAAASLVAASVQQDESGENVVTRSEHYTVILFRMRSSKDVPAFGEYEPDVLIAGPHNLYTAAYLDEGEAAEAIAQLKRDPAVRYAEKDTPVEATETEMTFRSHAADKMGLAPTVAWTAKAGKGSVVVAVIDSGVYKHNVLASRLTESGFDYVDSDFDATSDTNGHGTHVAGIVADCTQTLPVYIMPIRVLDAAAKGSKINTTNAIFEAAEAGCEVINLSLSSSSHSDALDDAVLFAIENGSTVVISAGNNAGNTSKYCPVHMQEEGLIVVAACSGTQEAPNPASYSNYGASVDVYAFGDSISSCSISGGYSIKSGTSQAAPHVSAACAIMQLLFPGITPQTVEKRMKSLAGDAEANVPQIALLTPVTLGCTAAQITLPVKTKIRLLQEAKPAQSFLTIKWSTSDETIAKVDEQGVLHCLSQGQVTLLGDGDANADVNVTLRIVAEEQQLKIPSYVTRIENEAFAHTISPVVRIPASIETIAEDAFDGSALETIVFLGDKPHLSQFVRELGITILMPQENPLWMESEAPYLLFSDLQ